MDPRTRILAVLLVSLLAIVLEHTIPLGLLALATTLPLLMAPIGWRWRGRALAGVAAVVWATTLSQGLFYAELPRSPAFELGPVILWKEGITHGLVQSLRLVAVTCAGLAVTATTPLDRLLAGLLKLRIPYSMAFLAVMSLRFLPEVGREVLVVRRARARRGRPTWKRSPLAWLRLEVSLLRPIVARAVRRARSIAESLEIRGFDASSPRAVTRPLQFRPWERWALLSSCSLTLALTVSKLLYLAYVAELVYLPQLRPLYGLVRQWL